MEAQTEVASDKAHTLLMRSGEMREEIEPKTKKEWLELRSKDITSTEVSALLGHSPYMTRFELWHRKKSGDIVEWEGNERTTWGSRLESSIAHGIAEDNNWEIRPMTEYMRLPESRIGSSFDFAIEAKEVEGEILNASAILEIKNVDSLQFRDGWLVHDDGTIEAPLHIEIQVQHQLLVSNRDEAYIGALVGGNRVVLIKRKRDEKIIEVIRQKVDQFWESINLNKPPTPDFTKDADFIATLYNYAEKGTVLTADASFTALADQYKKAAQHEKDAVETKKAIKAQILTLMGSYEKVRGDDFTISSGISPEAKVSYTRKPFRNFRVSWRKKK